MLLCHFLTISGPHFLSPSSETVFQWLPCPRAELGAAVSALHSVLCAPRCWRRGTAPVAALARNFLMGEFYFGAASCCLLLWGEDASFVVSFICSCSLLFKAELMASMAEQGEGEKDS